MSILFGDDKEFYKKLMDMDNAELHRLRKILGESPITKLADIIKKYSSKELADALQGIEPTATKDASETIDEVFGGSAEDSGSSEKPSGGGQQSSRPTFRQGEVDEAGEEASIEDIEEILEEAAPPVNGDHTHKEFKEISSQLVKLNETVEYLKDNTIVPVIYSVTVGGPDGSTSDVKGIFPPQWDLMLKLATTLKRLMLVGPTGCGKTYLSEKLAEAVNLPYYSVSCTAGMDEGEFKGWLLPRGEGMRFEYIPSTFIKAYEEGGVFCADEMDCADPNVLSFVNKALANQHFMLPQRFGNELVKQHKDFIWVACTNTVGTGADDDYTARNQLDLATLDRHKMSIVRLDYQPEVETQLVSAPVYQWGITIRAAMKALKIRHKPLSTRTLINTQTLVNSYEDMKARMWSTLFFEDWEENEKMEVLEKIAAMRSAQQ